VVGEEILKVVDALLSVRRVQLVSGDVIRKWDKDQALRMKLAGYGTRQVSTLIPW